MDERCHVNFTKNPFLSKKLCRTKMETLDVMESYNYLNEDACSLNWRIPGDSRNLRLKSKNLLDRKYTHHLLPAIIYFRLVG